MVNINTANEWFENLSFKEMERITNIYLLDYIFTYDDEVLADEMFIDACETWWNNHTDESKVAICRSWCYD